jgi:hypothetical protein
LFWGNPFTIPPSPKIARAGGVVAKYKDKNHTSKIKNGYRNKCGVHMLAECYPHKRAANVTECI